MIWVTVGLNESGVPAASWGYRMLLFLWQTSVWRGSKGCSGIKAKANHRDEVYILHLEVYK
jgi:hypothetical protein